VELNQLAAILYISITVLVIFFQFGLVFGAPWGEFTQGGRFKGTLPISGRVLAALSIPLLIFMALSIASVVGFIFEWDRWTAIATIAFQGVTALFNWITPSRKEKLLWGPVTTIAFGFCFYSVYI
jgi:hypothetical protein